MGTQGHRTLVLGGIRSGKSDHGESLLSAAPQVRYVATGATTSTDADWVARIRAHRDRRDSRYTTVETTDLADALRADPDTPTIVDDLGNWLAARLDALGAWADTDVDVTPDIDELCSAIAAFAGQLVIISSEVGLSVVSPTPAGRRFTDDLGALNIAVAAVCDRVHFVVAGRVLDMPAENSATTRPGTAAPPPVPAPAPNVTPAVPTPAASPPAASAPAAVSPPAAAATAARADTAETADTAGTAPTGIEAPDGTDAEVFGLIEPPDRAVAEQARARHLTLTKPPGSLGRLEELGIWVSSCQGACPPTQFTAPSVVLFAGDHGVAEGGVSAFPPEVTGQMVANFAAGGAAVNVLARRCGASVRVVDMSVATDTSPEISRFKVRRSSGDLRVTDALTIAEARSALAAGRAIADELVDGGADLLIAGDMGIGNTTPAAVLIGAMTRREPVEVVGRGTGIDDAGWIRKTAAIRDGMRRVRKVTGDPLAMLAAVGGADLTAMAGFLAQAAVRHTPVILDGVVVTAAALLANDLAPGAVQWWVAGHRSAEPAHTFALEHLDLAPLLEFSMRLGEGSGAVAALPIVAAAVDILTDMATFAEAGVTDSAPDGVDPAVEATASATDDVPTVSATAGTP